MTPGAWSGPGGLGRAAPRRRGVRQPACVRESVLRGRAARRLVDGLRGCRARERVEPDKSISTGQLTRGTRSRCRRAPSPARRPGAWERFSIPRLCTRSSTRLGPVHRAGPRARLEGRLRLSPPPMPSPSAGRAPAARPENSLPAAVSASQGSRPDAAVACAFPGAVARVHAACAALAIAGPAGRPHSSASPASRSPTPSPDPVRLPLACAATRLGASFGGHRPSSGNPPGGGSSKDDAVSLLSTSRPGLRTPRGRTPLVAPGVTAAVHARDDWRCEGGASGRPRAAGGV